ncbi:hexitol phosphatase HxpB [Bowmanella pacifica]|uniref:2-deoxyglucose-6-phosphatase n=1 Tax=Bowmanella pacifica TaxID=502051 RepID=A0A917YT44_9ALTE|nr:hexitol phosphatase HxpB [Bowmanella pacifica]GGO65733.1 2-deoxyglucose-6-phosphatase [Bowmanella pacifica]
MQLQAVIFDMDGLLIDSEPLWRQAEQEVFATVGIRLTESMCFQTTGLSTEEVVQYWYNVFSLERQDAQEVARRLEDRVIELVQRKGQALPGVYDLLKHCQNLGLTLAVASGSVSRLIEAVLDKLQLRDYIGLYHSAEHEVAGKPNPAVYLTTLDKLALDAAQCVAFEDSARGAQAAKAAGLFTIAVPEAGHKDPGQFAMADILLDSLEQALDLPQFQWPNSHKLAG